MNFKIRRDYFFIGFLILISLVLFLTNYKQGTYLVGWDNLFPEFNFAHTFKINLFSVWQEYRGLGVQDGMAHAANLMQTLYNFIVSFVLPQNVIRYFYHFSMHLLGGIGMFVFVRNILKKNAWVALIAGLFYQYNLATIQMFYAPFEVFSTHFAALPWLLYAIFLVLEQTTKKRIIFLFGLSLVFTPQAFVPTVFIAYLILVFSILFVSWLVDRKTIKNILIIVGIIIVTNAFWLFPFIHGAFNQGTTIRNTKINQMSYDYVFEHNKKRGTLLDIVYLKGFMLDIAESNLENKLVPIMADWNRYINSLPIFIIQTGFVFIFVFGLFYCIKQLFNTKKIEISKEYYFLPALLISFIMLGTNIPIIASINNLSRYVLPLFAEAFRFPFTKFLTVLSFCYTVFLVLGIDIISKKIKGSTNIFYCFIALLIFIYTFPSFKGNFIYNVIRLKIPQEYFQVIDYFNHQDKNQRIMTLPQSSFWNWTFYDWGERGSGFLWYGIEQPMLERPFDPWSQYNEQYFNEIFYALQTENSALFMNVVRKYDIGFILLDPQIVAKSKIQQYDKLMKIINTVFPYAEKTIFNKIVVYKLINNGYVQSKIGTNQNGSEFHNEFTDIAYNQNGDYYYGQNWQYSYLFPSLFTNKTQNDKEFDFSIDQNYLTIRPKNKLQINDSGSVNLSSLINTESIIPFRFSYQNGQIEITSINLLLQIGKESYEIQPFERYQHQLKERGVPTQIKMNGELINANNYYLGYSQYKNTIEVTYENGTIEVFQFQPNVDSTYLSPVINLRPTSGLVDVSIRIPIVNSNFNNEANILKENTYKLNSPCEEEIKTGKSTYKIFDNPFFLQFESNNSSTCFHQYVNKIYQLSGTYVYLQSKNIAGPDPELLIDIPEQKTVFIETKLNGASSDKLIIIPPATQYLYNGYGIHLRNVSEGSGDTINQLYDLQVGYIPYNWLRSLKIAKETTLIDKPVNQEIPFTHPFQFMYKFNTVSRENEVVYLSQSYNVGWKAWINGKEIKDHFLVNNWANGWKIPVQNSDSRIQNNIIIIFWPQYLEFIGFGLLLIAFVGILVLPRKSDS